MRKTENIVRCMHKKMFRKSSFLFLIDFIENRPYVSVASMISQDVRIIVYNIVHGGRVAYLHVLVLFSEIALFLFRSSYLVRALAITQSGELCWCTNLNVSHRAVGAFLMHRFYYARLCLFDGSSQSSLRYAAPWFLPHGVPRRVLGFCYSGFVATRGV